ncbi:hypothetical protein AVEN_211435-1 [Araneus ventricosus]|uniref:Uncharacterized protein n=1 Tax=Araneus ventricosus TaxID=182803 RepID=A0A4Y2KLE2_ARAVE|nr:hypothetical protein AVEN_211435-1 [Araneus ventricosus]
MLRLRTHESATANSAELKTCRWCSHGAFGKSSLQGGAAYSAFVATFGVDLSETESVLGAAIRLERKRFRTKTRVNTVTRYYGTMRRFAGETGAASLGNDETSATRSGYTTLPRKCEQRH